MESFNETSHLDAELRLLKQQVVEMMNLVYSQLENSKVALLNFDQSLAHEVILKERRVNSLELSIDKEVENTLALFQPVAIDLRLVMASFKINSDLERLGDHAEGIARYITKIDRPLNPDQLAKLNVEDMFANVLVMLKEVFEAYEEEDTLLARQIFKSDEELNRLNGIAGITIAEFIISDPEYAQGYLSTLSILRKLERCGDLAKNIAEEIIFYVEAKVLKHKGKKVSKKDRAG
jgi:phosphate transport system protein